MKKVGKEYFTIGMWFGDIIWGIRCAMADFDVINASRTLNSAENWLFWFGFICIVSSSCIILLNFIVAEVCKIYNVVNERINQII